MKQFVTPSEYKRYKAMRYPNKHEWAVEPSRNSELLASFIKYCLENPQLRFWQALRNWCGWGFVLVANGKLNKRGDLELMNVTDTFGWERNQRNEN